MVPRVVLLHSANWILHDLHDCTYGILHQVRPPGGDEVLGEEAERWWWTKHSFDGESHLLAELPFSGRLLHGVAHSIRCLPRTVGSKQLLGLPSRSTVGPAARLLERHGCFLP